MPFFIWESNRAFACYTYGPEALPFDRSALNGFRCVSNSGPVPEEVKAPRVMVRCDFSAARPVDEAAFKIYRDMYAYDRTPLDATAQAMADPSVDWTREKVTFTAAYGGERMSAYLFLPKTRNRRSSPSSSFPVRA